MTTYASGIILYRREDGAVRLLLLRNRDNRHWGFAKGRRDRADEHEVATALREVAEETGFRELALHGAFRRELEYTVRQAGGAAAYHKRVVYFLAEAPAGEPALSAEHDEALWADAALLQTHLAYGQLRDLARAALQELGAA
jgi:8-oxo-dGTP pyrophosphatase MutT (NUDIX family)